MVARLYIRKLSRDLVTNSKGEGNQPHPAIQNGSLHPKITSDKQLNVLMLDPAFVEVKMLKTLNFILGEIL